MVRWFLTFLLLLGFTTPLLASKPKAAAVVDTARSVELRRIEGRLSIFHKPDEKIDPNSVELDKKPLAVTFVKDRVPDAMDLRTDPNLDTDVIVSEYSFQLPGQPKGLYILPSISVAVNGQKVRSVATTYEITSAQASSALGLEASIDGQQPFYPGQHTFFTYTISYNRNVDLTEEQLPLLEAEGFQKVGGKQIKDGQTDSYSYQVITQEVMALQPGKWNFGPSIIEGVSYEEDITGKRKYDKQHLRAVAAPLTVEVVPYPADGRPASFTGALGQFSIKSRLLTPPKINIGEQVEVGVRITGQSDLIDLSMADISCQPGFSGFFQISDYPYFEQRENRSNEFIITLRPLSAHITEVPPMEFSYFDPQKRAFVSVKTEPIALEVSPLVSVKPETRSGRPEDSIEKTGPKEDINPGLANYNSGITGVDWRIWLGKPSEVTLGPIYPLTANDLTPPLWHIEYAWMAIAAVILLLLLEMLAKRLKGARPMVPRVLNSEDYLAMAGRARNDPAQMSSLLEEAFLLLLVEKGWYTKKVRSPEYLANDGPVGEVRNFLFEIAGKRFGGLEDFVPRDILRHARNLYRTIRYG